jgi:5'-deoxynucleotidase
VPRQGATKPRRKPTGQARDAERPRSHFFAYLSKMRFVKRWGVMRNTSVENLQEHSLQVAMLAHALAVIRNEVFSGTVDAERAAALALFHDAAEVFTGDIVAPIKHFSPKIRRAHAEIEEVAKRRLFAMLPTPLRRGYRSLLFSDKRDRAEWELVHAADKLCAYLKCIEELRVGNDDFARAAQALTREVHALRIPEVAYFLETFAPSFSMTLDELN